jgi:hypothetical protein
MTHVIIALEHPSGNVSRMQFGTFRKRHQLDDPVALKAGFELDGDGHWVREPTDVLIRQEIEKTVFAEPVIKWRRVAEGEELPPRRRAKSNVVPLPAPQGDEEPLPRMFRQPSPSVASEMQARLEDFDKRAAEVLETARQNIEASRSGEARFAKLEQQIADLGRDLRREMATAMRTIGGGT